MPLPSGSFSVGPGTATLTVRTGTAGAMARAGHSLEIRVATWSAQLELGDEPAAASLTLDADSHSLTVIDGSGGPKPLSDDDRQKIARTINDKILKGTAISFRSTRVEADGDSALRVHGQLTLQGTTGPVDFTVAIDDAAHLHASTEIVQTAFGIEPYSAMLGALKVKDELVIAVDGRLPEHP